MRTTVLHHFHTFHPEAQAELDRLIGEEKDLTLALARRGDVDEPEGRRRMSDPLPDLEGDLARVREAMEVQRKIISAGVVRIVIRGLSRGVFRRLMVEHAPRADDPLDQKLGYNSDSFGDALIRACIVRTEDLDGNTVPCDWGLWADEMTNGQWEEVLRACLSITNEGEPVLPR